MNLKQIVTGAEFRNIHMPWHDFLVVGVDREKNIARVRIIPQDKANFEWEEDWNLQHTEWGLEKREYHSLILPKIESQL